MTAGITALLFAIGVAAWIYSKFSHRTNSVQNSLIIAAVIGLIAFIVFFTAIHSFLK